MEPNLYEGPAIDAYPAPDFVDLPNKRFGHIERDPHLLSVVNDRRRGHVDQVVDILASIESAVEFLSR